jgi:hypothetical protein
MSVCPFVRVPAYLSDPIEQFGFHWVDFHEIWDLKIFRKSVEKIQVSLPLDKNNSYFTWKALYIYDNISLNSL